MSDTILTPTLIWNEFKIEDVEAKFVSGEKLGDVKISRLFLSGREVEDGRVEIFGVLFKNSCEDKKLPYVLVIQDFLDGTDENLCLELVSRGYNVLAIDLAGSAFGREFYTKYPESISYANYNKEELLKNSIYSDATKTCYYEWTSAIRYSLRFLKSVEGADCIGALGIGEPAISLWQAAAFSDELTSVCFVKNAGKKSGAQEDGEDETKSALSNAELKFEAGIKPQSYAGHIFMPTLIVSPTNCEEFNPQVAYDTLSKIGKKVYKNIIYSVHGVNSVDHTCFEDIITFFNKTLYKKDKKELDLPEDVDFSCQISDGEIKCNVKAYGDGVKEVCVFVSEGTEDIKLRSWHKLNDASLTEDGAFGFSYPLYYNSKVVYAFARVSYQCGYSVCSNIAEKTFDCESVKQNKKPRIIFSTREQDLDSDFFVKQNDTAPHGIDVFGKNKIEIKKGAYDMCGLSVKGGVCKFIKSEKNIPILDAMLMFDAFKENGGNVEVKLITDYFGEKCEYVAKATLGKGVWQNVKLARTNFKSSDGRVIKDYSDVEVLEFYSDDDLIINNALWL